jgi:hypothetical protein
MRFLLLAPFASFEADRDAEIIRLLGHDVDTYYGLANVDHPRNGGAIKLDSDLHKLVVLEIIGGAQPVIHPELVGNDLKDLLHICNYLQVPVVDLNDLNTLLFGMVDITPERIDSINVLAPRLADLANHKPYTTNDPGEVQAPHQGHRLATSPRVPTLGDRLRTAKARLLRWEQRVNARLGYLLKNPMSRARQAPVRTYKLHTGPVSSTG